MVAQIARVDVIENIADGFVGFGIDENTAARVAAAEGELCEQIVLRREPDLADPVRAPDDIPALLQIEVLDPGALQQDGDLKLGEIEQSQFRASELEAVRDRSPRRQRLV